MEKKIYITEEERAKCQKVADAFAELYEMADMVVVDVGRYGFVMLKYYTPLHGFEEDETFTDSRTLFEELYQIAGAMARVGTYFLKISSFSFYLSKKVAVFVVMLYC